MSFGELGRIIGSNWLRLDKMVSWSPSRYSGGRTSEPDGASEELWRLPSYTQQITNKQVLVKNRSGALSPDLHFLLMTSIVASWKGRG